MHEREHGNEGGGAASTDVASWLSKPAVAGAALLVVLGRLVDDSLPGARTLARGSARFVVPWFLAAFRASTAARLRPGPFTRAWLRARSALGFTFAVTLAVHLGVLGWMTWRWPAEMLERTPPVALGIGGLTSVFVLAMGATSLDAARLRVGARAWRWLHGVGSHLVWLALVAGTVPRAIAEPAWWLVTALLVGLVPLWIRVRRRAVGGQSPERAG